MNDTLVTQMPLEAFINKKLGTSKKQFNKMSHELPCHKCIVKAVCKSKDHIQCNIILEYIQMCLAYGANTLRVHKELTDLFPRSSSFNGTVLL